MGIVDRIMDDTVTWQEIWAHNIDVVQALIDREETNKHDSKTCKISHCKHGNSRHITLMIEHRGQLIKEARVIAAGIDPTEVR